MNAKKSSAARSLIALAVAASIATPSLARDEAETQAMLYVSVPLGGGSTRERAASYGFQLRRSSEKAEGLASFIQQQPIVDVRFNANADYRLRTFGIDAYDSHAAEVSKQPMSDQAAKALVGVAVLGGIAVVAVAVKNHDDKKEKEEDERRAACASNPLIALVLPIVCVLGRTATPSHVISKPK